MVTYLQFPIVIFKPATKKEKILGLILAAVMFAPFIYGLIAENYKFCLSIPIVIIVAAFFEDPYGKKDTPEDILRKKDSICFDEDGFQIVDLGQKNNYLWKDLIQININIIAYKNKIRDEDDRYHGTENFISFYNKGILEYYNFYIDKQNQFNFISDFFEFKILPTLYINKSIMQESIIIAKLDYTRLQQFKAKYNINRYTDYIHFN
jgi:hypothetical protein